MTAAKFTRRRFLSAKRILLMLAILGLAAANIVLLLNTVVIARSEAYILPPQQLRGYDADCVLVLGARVYSDGRLSLILRDRADQGIALYEAGAAPKLLFSGDHGTIAYDEVNALKAYALDKEVPLDDIFLDHAGFSTYESMYRARNVFGAKRVVIVTQRFHLYRAVYIARALGLEAVGVDSSLQSYMRSTMIKNELREEVARAKDWFYSRVKPLPTYLGSPIDLKGSGTATHDAI